MSSGLPPQMCDLANYKNANTLVYVMVWVHHKRLSSDTKVKSSPCPAQPAAVWPGSVHWMT